MTATDIEVPIPFPPHPKPAPPAPPTRWEFTDTEARGNLARVWTSVFSVAGKTSRYRGDKIGRKMLVEVYPNGLQLVASDGYMLLVGYASFGVRYTAPGRAQDPEYSFVVDDKHGMVKSLMGRIKTANNLNSKAKPGIVVLSVDREMSSFSVSYEGQKVTVPVSFEDWVNWRKIFDDMGPAKPLETITVNPDFLKQLARLPSMAHMKLEFTGEFSAIRVTGPEGIFGALMPIRDK